MIIAAVGWSLKVSGSSIAVVAGGPSPGRTQITVPSTTPITHIVRLGSVSATWNPCSSPPRMSMRLEQQSVRQCQVERELEERVEAEREPHRHRDRNDLPLPRHHLHDEPGEERARDHQARERPEGDASD